MDVPHLLYEVINVDMLTARQISIVLFFWQAAVQYSELMEMEYLDMVINESLRVYPIVQRLERVAKAGIEINGVVIPKDMAVVVPTWPLHRDPDLWPQPEKFQPER